MKMNEKMKKIHYFAMTSASRGYSSGSVDQTGFIQTTTVLAVFIFTLDLKDGAERPIDLGHVGSKALLWSNEDIKHPKIGIFSHKVLKDKGCLYSMGLKSLLKMRNKKRKRHFTARKEQS